MAAIREATRGELADFGYAGVTYEGVARRAQTGKPVLYRRYPSRAHMVVDALPSLQWQPDDDLVWTDSLREDLLLLFGTVMEVFEGFGVANYRSLIAEADADLFRTLDAQVTSLAERTVYPALERARARGEVGPREIPPRAAASIGVLVRNEMVLSPNPVDAGTLQEIIDTVYLPLIQTLSS
jgi:AcrR family transcriptional regulator